MRNVSDSRKKFRPFLPVISYVLLFAGGISRCSNGDGTFSSSLSRRLCFVSMLDVVLIKTDHLYDAIIPLSFLSLDLWIEWCWIFIVYYINLYNLMIKIRNIAFRTWQSHINCSTKYFKNEYVLCANVCRKYVST